MMTEIHAQSHRSSKESRENEDCNPSTSGTNSQGPAPKKHAGDKKVALAEKKKKDKKADPEEVMMYAIDGRWS